MADQGGAFLLFHSGESSSFGETHQNGARVFPLVPL